MSLCFSPSCCGTLRLRQPKAAPTVYSWLLLVRPAPHPLVHIRPLMTLAAGQGQGNAVGCLSSLHRTSPTLIPFAARGVTTLQVTQWVLPILPTLPLSCPHHPTVVCSLTASLLLPPCGRQHKATWSTSISSPVGECHSCLNPSLSWAVGQEGSWITSTAVPNFPVVRDSS